jgi:hypothetical protein
MFVLTALMCQQVHAQSDFPATRERYDLSKSVQIFPNPAVDFVHVRLDQVSVQNVRITLHNIIGNKMDVETEIVDDNELRVRVKDLAAGYYLLALKDEDDQFRGTFKILKR